MAPVTAAIDPRHRTVRHPSTEALFGDFEAPVRPWIDAVMAVTDAGIAARGGLTHRALVEPIARAAGLDDGAVERCGAILDATQVLIDLADNLADVAEDRARGRAPLDSAGVPEASLHCLPAALACAVMNAIHEGFPPPLRGAAAARRTLAVLGRMIAGQAAPAGSDARVDLASGMQGLLACLPLWLTHRDTPAEGERLAAIERWAFAFGRTWELRQIVAESPASLPARARLRAACDEARAAWPAVSPFRPGEALAAARWLS